MWGKIHICVDCSGVENFDYSLLKKFDVIVFNKIFTTAAGFVIFSFLLITHERWVNCKKRFYTFIFKIGQTFPDSRILLFFFPIKMSTKPFGKHG